ncbi:hypothetical protein ACJMK2_028129, partial [Sinanodonta woodiana]
EKKEGRELPREFAATGTLWGRRWSWKIFWNGTRVVPALKIWQMDPEEEFVSWSIVVTDQKFWSKIEAGDPASPEKLAYE